jgi:uncharacterized protein
MPMITDDMRDIIRRAILSFVATVNEDNTPNLSPKASLMAREDHLFFANMASPQTIANLKRNPAIEINVVDIFSRRGYRFKGHAELLSEGSPDFAVVAEWVWGINGREYPVHDVVRIRVAEAKPLLSPAYVFGAGITEDGLRAAYMPKYGVKDAKV